MVFPVIGHVSDGGQWNNSTVAVPAIHHMIGSRDLQSTTSTGTAMSFSSKAEFLRSGMPFIDKAASPNVTGLLGKTAYLNCRVKNLGDKQVSWWKKDWLVKNIERNGIELFISLIGNGRVSFWRGKSNRQFFHVVQSSRDLKFSRKTNFVFFNMECNGR